MVIQHMYYLHWRRNPFFSLKIGVQIFFTSIYCSTGLPTTTCSCDSSQFTFQAESVDHPLPLETEVEEEVSLLARPKKGTGRAADQVRNDQLNAFVLGRALSRAHERESRLIS